MALKDWKKVGKSNQWNHKKLGSTIMLSKNNVGSHIVLYWRPDMETNTGTMIYSEGSAIGGIFKTKSQAIKFAKAYMRSH